ncbi:DUF2075 domain-containing protein [Levilactobacillus brevis]|uniref:DUF2075 domain-containing protein n=1 Tax=Levilactobacillus brevis TaxID=1580 RepID=UPI0021A7FD09|nr:DUF2075 domain-containing protein [Levilactobacillus brevis]MCT3566457.1 DUF2075 domain-containing protein [Levilactobacillus brevis]
MTKAERPVITETEFSQRGLTDIKKNVRGSQVELLLEYPTVYIVYNQEGSHDYQVYVGETNDIERRTRQHLEDDVWKRTDWKYLAESTESQMLVIGHPHFNKSLTLDIENQMMLYLSGVEDVKKLNNRRENQQNKYYTANEKDRIFSTIWQKLHEFNADLFPTEKIVRDSSLFKASPFHTLTDEQTNARELILRRITMVLHTQQGHQLIWVKGEAGSGKTVLLSTLFYQLDQLGKDLNYTDFNMANNYLLVNHDEQVKVYKNIAEKLGLESTKVSKPTTFITHHSPQESVDVVLIDEAHLLWTQGKQSYRGHNQLQDILERAKVVVAVFDQHQILKTEEYITSENINKLEHQAEQQGNLIELKNQLRMNANEKTREWLYNLTEQRIVSKIPTDLNYDLRIFEDPVAMYEAIKTKAENEDHGLSRMLATFDWPFKRKKNGRSKGCYMVTVGKLSLPWNLQLPLAEDQKGQSKHLAWAEQHQTIGEVGSTYTVQGFDLNYSGVIIGPSVKYRNGKVIFDPTASQNRNAIRKRTLDNDQRVYVSDELLSNELNVLLTRGVNGLYIYAVDDELRRVLRDANKK